MRNLFAFAFAPLKTINIHYDCFSLYMSAEFDTHERSAQESGTKYSIWRKNSRILKVRRYLCCVLWTYYLSSDIFFLCQEICVIVSTKYVYDCSLTYLLDIINEQRLQQQHMSHKYIFYSVLILYVDIVCQGELAGCRRIKRCSILIQWTVFCSGSRLFIATSVLWWRKVNLISLDYILYKSDIFKVENIAVPL